MNYKNIGVMIDCSRNGVMTVEKVKEYATLIAGMGYNMLQLYTEDTYEIESEPFFGYMRGRYTKEEIKEIDAHCAKLGIELVPCIQTLAHLGRLSRWPVYKELFDTSAVLLVGEEKVYNLIDKMFATLAECFTSRRVHIGMDEAHSLGLGKYLDKHGYCNRSLLMAEHLKKVKELAEKHGFTPMMWSDMFFRLNNNGSYCPKEVNLPQETIDAVPGGVELVYWDYYSKDKARYDKMFEAHAKFKNNPTAFAGGLWTSRGYVPNLRFCLDATEAAMRSLQEHPVNTVLFTMWGDNGKDCSFYAALPAVFAAAEMVRGNFDRADIAAKFEAYMGYSFDEFMALELPNITEEEESHYNNPCKYLLFNDPFLGLFDFTVDSQLPERYAAAAKQVKASVNGRKYDYLFDFVAKLLEVLSVKCDLGIRLRKAYTQRDMQELSRFAQEEFPMLTDMVEELYDKFRELWLLENKGFGLEVQENRFGGLLLRLKSCRVRLDDFIAGKVDKIDELEAKQEIFLPDKEGKSVRFNNFGSTYTTSCH